MPTITERELVLEFLDGWQVVQYDRQANSKTGEPASFYRRIIEQGGVTHVRGVDIICRLPGLPERLEFIEIKDDRKRTMKAGPRHAELFTTVLQKTAGTLAGLVLAERLGEESLRPHACLSQNPTIEVILLLVEPAPVPVQAVSGENNLRRLAERQGKTTLEQRLNAKLEEWGLRFALYNLSNRPAPDWQVRDLSQP
ncbi:hypothetical protein [uncultured Hymenobacter sp.]|uniref:hypothetical protein n=1 Tax=uncultured Hymenobacter sp. TaxID=170016 RepID=UPI0035CB8366